MRTQRQHDNSPQSLDLLELYLMTKEIEGRSPATVVAYRRACERLCEFMPDRIADWTGDTVTLWLGRMRRDGRSPSGIAWYQGQVWVFLGWLHMRGDLPIDIRKGIARVTAPLETMPAVTDAEFAAVIAAARNRPVLADGSAGKVPHYWRGIALLHMLYATGLRRSELVGLEYADIDLKDWTVTVRGAVAKTKRPRRVPLDRAARDALARYIIKERGREPGSLYGMSVNAIHQYLYKLGGRAGVHVSAHMFRRGFAARVRRQGLDIGHTMRLLGHSSPTMTIRYSETGEEEAAIAAYREKVG